MNHRRYLTDSTARREQRHRRVVLLGIAMLILLATSPVLVHHVGASAGSMLVGYDHLWALCVAAVLELLHPVHELFHLLLAIGLAFALWDRVAAWRNVHRSLRILTSRHPEQGDGIHEAAVAAGVPLNLIRIVDGLPVPAFTAGWLWPRVYVARVMTHRLQTEELAAVLAHEHAHARRRDPARLSLLRFMGCLLFWLPALRRLAADVADEAEIAADDEAGRRSPLVLASAILQVASWRSGLPAAHAGPRWRTEGVGIVTGLRGDPLLDRRIRRLAGEDVVVNSHLTRRSLATAALALVLVWMSGLAVMHPLAAGDAGVAHHCEHRHEWAFRHLFCALEAPTRDGLPCPHAGEGTP
jgi:Zn-dependent protease with chaperone function